MVGRLQTEGNCIYRRIVNPGTRGTGRFGPQAASARPPTPPKVVDAASCSEEGARCRNHAMPPPRWRRGGGPRLERPNGYSPATGTGIPSYAR
jgi:hypothetical protein